MKSLGIDFVATAPHVSKAGAALLLCGFVVVGVSGTQYYDARQSVVELREKLAAAAAAERRNRSQPMPDDELLRARVRIASQVVEKRAVPWDTLFRDIEAASGKDIAVLAIQPDANGKEVRLSGEARDSTALTAYLERLEAQPSLAYVFLAEHELKPEQGRGPLRFTVQANWVAQ